MLSSSFAVGHAVPPNRKFSAPIRTLAVGLTAVVTLACGDAAREPSRGAWTAITDHFGDTLRPDPAARIVSMMPASTEILFALGAGEKIVGRSEFDRWPPAALERPDLGPGLRPNVEAILAVRPDLVILYASQDNRGAARRLREAGIRTAAFKVDSIEQFDRLTRLLGRLVGDSARGALVADTVMRTLDSVRALTQSLSRPTVVMPSWDQPLIVIGGGSFMSQLITIAGGRNIYDSIPSPSPTVTFEDVVRLDPEFVLIGPERAAVVRASAKWRTLPAVREGRVRVIDTSVTLRPATRLGEGAVSLAKLLHPELAPR